MFKDFHQEIEQLKEKLRECVNGVEKIELLLGLADGVVVGAPLELKPFFEEALSCALEKNDLKSAAQLARRLAEICRLLNNFEGCRKYTLQVLEIAQKINDPKMEGVGNYLLGMVNESLGEFQKAKGFYLQALKIWRELDFHQGVNAAFNQLGNIAGLQGRFDQAIDYYLQCKQVQESDEFDDFSRAINCCNLGWAFLQQGKWEEAEENLFRTVAIAEQRGYELMRWNAFVMLGELFRNRDRLERAAEMFSMVIEAGRQSGLPADLLWDSLANFGETKFRQHNFAAASQAYTEAISLCERLNDRLGKSQLLWRMAELEFAQGQLNRCQGLCDKALQLARELDTRKDEAEALRVLGLMEAEKGMNAAAQSYFKQALELLADLPESYAAARVRLQYGKFLLEQGEREEGERELRSAARTFRRLGVIAESDEVNRLLFGLELDKDREGAMLSAVANLATLGLEPEKFISHSLLIIRKALGCDGAALLIGHTPVVSEGRISLNKVNSVVNAGSLPLVNEQAVCLPVKAGGELLGLIYLERRESKFADFHQPVLETTALIMAPAVQRLRSYRVDLPTPTVEISALSFSGVIGKSAAMRRNLEIVVRCADSVVPVLIRGESGTGKELIARAIHNSGSRRDKPFVPINCAAIPETLLEAEFFGVEKGAATGVLPRKGKFEIADGGTVFLDEIGDMSPALQAKLLRVLQEKEFERVGGTKPVKVDIRVVAATNQNIERLIEQGRFRQDLYYRLNGVEICLPPLRERKEDIPELVRYFFAQINQETNRQVRNVSREVMDCLLASNWEGNIRQLQHVIQRAVVLCRGDELRLEDLPIELQELARGNKETEGHSLRATRILAEEKAGADIEQAALIQYLEQADGNVTKAAELAGYSRAQFYRLLKKHNIKFR